MSVNKIENQSFSNNQQNVNTTENKGKVKYVCNICKKKFCNLMRHMKRVHPNEISSKIYFCDHCPKKFLLKSFLISHLKSKHQKGKEIKFECDFDGKFFDTKTKIYYHMTVCHQTIEECKVCGRKVKSLNQHLRQVHATDIENVQCHICHKTCKNQYLLNFHLQTHNKQHQCQTCGRKFSLIGQLKIHVEIHKNLFAYRCEKCQKNFNSPSNLRAHTEIHDKNRITKYKYSQCEYSTHNKQHLTIHVKTHDKNREKNLKCPKCDYKTDRKEHLKSHLQTHNPNRVKFPCLYCNYEATQRDSLKIHIKAKHELNKVKRTK
ncbi:hypothetical protein PVAND_017419 [Polypedilum vanderplanki]|uniref:C2H2-type domain-containing protein n=1 Tax=Polypedilum vanderplanki TaxID=319348 RepID=A0A9J6BI83_POLVA|nr:hypothetical protein PVAND_017419 [Polypedilum vanderplanki]